jgi:exosortase A-associated hydrolase 2
LTEDPTKALSSARRPAVSASFEEFEGHRSVVVHWRASAQPKAMVLFIPAFGDEMNQTRRMVRLTAQALVERNVASCIFDLHGTGDSSADFSEATVEHWLADCRTAAARVPTDPGIPLILIGCRLGVALAAQLTHDLSEPAAALIGWAPVLQGRAQLSGLLRAASVSRMQRADAAGPDDARSRWAAGQTAVLAGYSVSPMLAEQLEAFDAARAPRVGSVTLIDVRMPVGDVPVSPSEALRKRAAAWAEQGVPTEVRAVAGAGFWNVSDLVDVPELVEATVTVVERVAGSAAT